MMKRTMKKTAAVLLAVLMALSLAACMAGIQTEEQTSEDGLATGNPSADSDFVQSEPAETTPASDDESISDTAPESEPAENTPAEEPAGGKILVAYFSATHTTEGIAQTVADILSADLYEIVPEQPYTDADLNYHDDASRTSIEMNDPEVRPAISGSVENMEQYDIIFLGYPIWWGKAPRIMSTFVESYDFSGMTVVPFCTSGSSGVGSSAAELEQLADGARWLPGTRFAGGSSRETLVEWVNGLDLALQAEQQG